MRMAIVVTLDLDVGARGQPRGEDLVDAEAELIEAKVGAPRLGAHRDAARELRHHLDVAVVVRGAHEESAEPRPADLTLREPELFQDVIALEIDLALSVRRRRHGRS